MGGGCAPPNLPAFFLNRAGVHEQEMFSSFSKLIIEAFCFQLNWGGASPFFQAVQYRFRYHLAGKDRTHMNPLRTRHKDVVFANGGAACAPQPPLSFSAVQACFHEHRTMNKTCIKHKTVLELLKTHHIIVSYYVLVCYIILYYVIFKLCRNILNYRTARTVTRTLARTITQPQRQQ